MTQQRNNLALRGINPSFRLENDAEVNYTLPLDEFQKTLVQQTAARKATREATLSLQRIGSLIFSIRSTLAAGWYQQQQQQQQQLHQPVQQQGQQQQQQFSTKRPQEKLQPISSVNPTAPTSTATATSLPIQINNITTDPIGGRLSKHSQQWTNITNNFFVINTVQHGYHIPFYTTPPITTIPTSITPFSADQATLIDQAIQDLLDKSAIEKVSPHQVQQVPWFYSSMFVIPKKSGDIRPVFNLKNLNQYLDAPHFKMETIREVSLMIKRNDYLVSIDLSDAFLHV
ncbi:uncharacterized protein ATC70_008609 [Mucor velutinosus]|uniref:Reverse transcriptase domain-containing protein n=1 Tax=Mucor velutinosus TaxID=708070 RepID=A0AAN7I2S0_9FUNG|nr:hypothetical protein ATC70_008609 [Mucor velutinosus]